MSWLKKQFKAAKSELKEEFRHRAEIRREEKLSLKAERLAQAKRMGKQKAKIEADEKLKKYRQQVKNRSKGYTFQGFAGPTQNQPNISLGVSEYLLGSQKPSKKKKRNDDLRLF